MTVKPLQLYSVRVPPEWLDYNGHMNDACYAIAFSRATDRLIEYIGLDAAYREREHCTVYTLENHICYLHEAQGGDELYATTQLLEHDAKRLRVFHGLYRDRDNTPLATSEQMLLHVDSGGPRAAPFAQPIEAQLQQLAQAHRQLPLPERAGCAIRQLSTRG